MIFVCFTLTDVKSERFKPFLGESFHNPQLTQENLEGRKRIWKDARESGRTQGNLEDIAAGLLVSHPFFVFLTTEYGELIRLPVGLLRFCDIICNLFSPKDAVFHA